MRSQGSISLFAIFFSMVIITIAVAFNIIVRENLKMSLIIKEKMDALLLAKTTENILIYTILSGFFTSKDIRLYKGNEFLGIEKIPLNGEVITLSLPQKVQINLQDTNGLISLINFKPIVLKNLLKKFTEDDNRAEIIIDSYLDWIDKDDFSRLKGAEKDFYQRENFPYTPRNYQIQYKEELTFVRGMDSELYKKIEPYITQLPSTGFNPNTAKDEVLVAYLDISNDTLAQLKDYISKKPLTSDLELFPLTGRKIVVDESVYYFPSRIVEMSLRVLSGEKPIYTLKLGIDFTLKMNKPYEILYYKEE